MAKNYSTASTKTGSTNSARAYSGSLKTVGRSQNIVSTDRSFGSAKALYSTSAKKENEQNKKTNNASKTENSKKSFGDKNTGTGSVKSMYNSSWETKPDEEKRYTVDDIFPRKTPEDRVNVGQLAYGVVDQAANQFVGDILGAADMFIGTPYQKALDYAEDKLGLPDLGVNALSTYNKRFQQNAAREAKYYAQNASKSEFASLINEYGPDVVALIPEIALAFASGGSSAVAGAGVKGLSAVSKLSKADNVLDTMKLAGKWIKNDAIKDAGKWVKNNPNAAMNFVQTSGAARNQALSEGATEAEAFAYALLNGGTDAMISKYGVGEAKRGIESLPKSLRDGWKKVSNTVKSADAMAEEVAEGQIYGLMQRSARGLYDENAKLFSLRDKNAVINPKAMLESAVMDTISPAAMGGIDRRKGSPEPTNVKVDAEVKKNSDSRKEGKGNKTENHNTRNKTQVEKQDVEKDSLIQSLLNGDFSKIEDAPAYVLMDPKVQSFVREESGVNISPLDNAKRREMIQKYKLAGIEMSRKKSKGERNGSYSKRSLEKAKVGTYNKAKDRE